MDNIPQEIPLKQCSKCLDQYPATPEFFTRDKKRPDGLYSYCKQCRHKPPRPSDVPEGHRRCPACKEIHPLTPEFFHRNKAQPKGFDYQCNTCKNKREREHSMLPEVREVRLIREKTWNDTHKEYLKEYHQVYNQVNKEAESQRGKRYYQEHKKHTNARHKRHYRQNKGMYRAIAHAYRTRKRGATGRHTSEQIREQLKRQKYRCYYAACGHSKFKRVKGKYVYHVDHTFPLSRVSNDIPANGIDYLVLSCPSCNIKKKDKYPWEWAEGGRLL